MKTLTVIALATFASVLPAAAQFGKPADPQTKFELIDQSLEQLLNTGYQVQQVSQGMFVLAKGERGPKSSWVAAYVIDVTNGMLAKPAEQKTTTSPCFALNESTVVCSAAQKAVLP